MIATRHIATDPQRREIEAVERLPLMEGPGDILRRDLEPILGWTGRWAWYAVRIPTGSLLRYPDEIRGLPGDIDVMGGPLTANPQALEAALQKTRPELPPQADPSWAGFIASLRVFYAKELNWPPNLDRITAVEVKSASRDSNGKIHAHRKTPRRRTIKQRRYVRWALMQWLCCGSLLRLQWRQQASTRG